MQVLDDCPTCQQAGRQLKRVRLMFHMMRLTMQAPGIFQQPVVEACLVCDPRLKQLFIKLRQHVKAVRPIALAYRGATLPRCHVELCCIRCETVQCPLWTRAHLHLCRCHKCE